MNAFLQRIYVFSACVILLALLPHAAVFIFRFELHNAHCIASTPELSRTAKQHVIQSGSSTIKYGCDPIVLETQVAMPSILIADDAHSPARNFYALRTIVDSGDIVVQSIDPWIYFNAYRSLHPERLITLSIPDRIALHKASLFPRTLASQHRMTMTLLQKMTRSFLLGNLSSPPPIHSCKNLIYSPSKRLLDCIANPNLTTCN